MLLMLFFEIRILNTCANDAIVIMLKNNMRKYIAYYTRFKITIERTKVLLLRAQ
jgi:hypothetical protein